MLNSVQDSYFDFSTLSALKNKAKSDPRAALKQVAGEFESIFLKMMMKSMRDASFGDPLFDSESAKIYRDMYDDQLSVELSRNGGVGLADMLVKQMEHYLPSQNKSENSITQKNLLLKKKSVNNSVPEKEIAESPKSFVQALWPVAQKTAKQLGVSPKLLLAQAALETGWGKYVIKNESGKNSFNLFNIKSDQRWSGEQVKIASLEYIAGEAKSQTSFFRAYNSYEESFKDFADFLQQGERYQKALSNAKDDKRFVEELQAAGYATDPDYAKKILRIMNDKPLNQALSELELAGFVTKESHSSLNVALIGERYANR